MPVQDLINKYCVDPNKFKGEHPGEKCPEQASMKDMENHRAEAYIDGVAYFTAIQKEMNSLIKSTEKDRFFYMTAWLLGLSAFKGRLKIKNLIRDWEFPVDEDVELDCEEFPLVLLQQKKIFENLLEEMVAKGIDVRILPWASPNIVFDFVGQVLASIGVTNFHTLKSVTNLRNKIGKEKVTLNLLAHTFGAVHCKLIVCGDKNSMRAYVSGLDPEAGRLTPPGLAKKDKNLFSRTYSITEGVMSKLSDKLTKSVLGESVYNYCSVIGQQVLEEIKRQEREQKKELKNCILQNFTFPSWDDFRKGKAAKTHKCDIFTRRKKKKWLLILDIEHEDPEDSDTYLPMSYKFNIERTGQSLTIYHIKSGGWHDIGVKVEGSAAGSVYDFIRDLWNEQLKRKVESFSIDGESIYSHYKSTETIKDRTSIALPLNTGNQYVQVLRTVPEMNFKLATDDRIKFLSLDNIDILRPRKLFGIPGYRPKIKPVESFSTILGKIDTYNRKPLSFAKNGCFEFKVALKKAISQADNYIFIADQAMQALEIMDWINERVLEKPELKVILLYGADPSDPPNNFLTEAINNHLLNEMGSASTTTSKKIKFCNTIIRDTDGEPKNIVFWEWLSNVVHCKVTIIDDVWCAIGSANCMRRSLYTDIELSVSILEPSTADNDLPSTPAEELNPPIGKKAPSFIQRFRRDLWAHYCGIPLDVNTQDANEKQIYTNMLKLNNAISIWNPERWSTTLSQRNLNADISRQTLNPFPIPQSTFNINEYDLQDADSKKNF